MQLNIPAQAKPTFTYEGAPASLNLKPIAQLRRLVMTCLLWEDQFYIDGQDAAKLIIEAAEAVSPEILAGEALYARNIMNLRHVPLLLLDVLSRTGAGRPYPLVADTVKHVIQRPDEFGELLAILWRDGRKMIPAQMRKGMAQACDKFDEYQWAKYDRDDTIKLRDVLRLVHPKPKDEIQSALFKRIKDRTLAVPDTWEVALSAAGSDKAKKREIWERLLNERKLGYLALLRNLRNMEAVGVLPALVNEAIAARRGAQRVLPFRYVAAARAAPQFEPALDAALLLAIKEMIPLAGSTFVLVDNSGSMAIPLSAKSELTRIDAAAALAAMVPGDVRMFAFSNSVTEVPPRRGMAGIDALKATPVGGTFLGAAIHRMNAMPHDRLIVVSDEQSHDVVPDPWAKRAYMINIGGYQNGVSHQGKWVHIDGFSEAIFRYISATETAEETTE